MQGCIFCTGSPVKAGGITMCEMGEKNKDIRNFFSIIFPILGEKTRKKYVGGVKKIDKNKSTVNIFKCSPFLGEKLGDENK